MSYLKFALFSVLISSTSLSYAASDVFELQIKDHRFIPDTLTVPANAKIKLKITNSDATPEEFESYKLKREKIIPANSTGVVFIGPLEAGEYEFYGEFHAATAQGKITAQ